jgi:hypothetical protein
MLFLVVHFGALEALSYEHFMQWLDVLRQVFD